MEPTSRMIFVTFQKEGIHKYPAALEDPKLKDVEFLGYPHRHIFHFKVWIEVWHDDRDLEFIQFKRWLLSLYENSYVDWDKIIDEKGRTTSHLTIAANTEYSEPNNAAVLELDHKSCEMMSDDLFKEIHTKYPGRAVWIEVSEDGENGAFSKYGRE